MLLPPEENASVDRCNPKIKLQSKSEKAGTSGTSKNEHGWVYSTLLHTVRSQ